MVILISTFILIIGLITIYIILNYKFQKKLDNILKAERVDAIKRSRAVLTGQFSENIAPYMPNFPYSPTECKFLGKPVDFIVFKGSDNNNIKEVIFLEIKSGNSKLNKQEKNLKEAIINKNVKWDEYRVK